jgi:hypothetical protein
MGEIKSAHKILDKHLKERDEMVDLGADMKTL